MKGAVGFKKPRSGNRVPESPGGNSGERFKPFAKSAMGFISHVQGDVDRSQAPIKEQETGTLHPFAENILMGRLPHDRLENPIEMKIRITGLIGQFRKPATLVHMPVNVQHHPLDAVAVVDNGGGGVHDTIAIIWP
jgi:hypothetical protein